MRALLERSEARVYLDARRTGVQLPPHLLTEPQLRLDYSYGFSPPIPDLVVDEKGISATLSFSQRAFATFVPWEAVYLIADYDGNGGVWQEDIPGEVLERVALTLEQQKPTPPPPPQPNAPAAPVAKESSRPKLVSIPDAPPADDVTGGGAKAPESEAPSDDPPRPRPTLRLVK